MMTRHDVPYFSQWESADLVGEIISGNLKASQDPRWADSGAEDPLDYDFWSWRICGMACLKMILAFRGQSLPPMVELAIRCTEAGGYVRHVDRVDGLIYRPFVQWIESDFGIRAAVRGNLAVRDIVSAVNAGTLAMISVHPWIRWVSHNPPTRGGHLVLVTGTGPDHLLIHNPSGLPDESQQYARVDFASLEKFYAGRGILFHP